MKILSFEMENVKRVALVRMAPGENGLTVIGGKNAAGKTSVLDGIVYALGGEKYRPTDLQRADGMAPARIRIELSGGLVVERRGKNASLHVTDATGRRRGQKLLDDFVEELALNLPKFLAMKDSEKAEVLLQTLGIADKLEALDLKEKAAYDKRHDFGVLVDQKVKFAAELKEYADVPDAPVSAADLITEMQSIVRRNAERAERRQQARKLAADIELSETALRRMKQELEAAEEMHRVLLEEQKSLDGTPDTPDESTDDLEAKIADIDALNAKVRANLDKQKALDEADDYKRRLEPLTAELEAVRKERLDLLNGAKMPLPELTIGKDGKGRPVLSYKGHAWDCMSTMEQYRVAAAIVRELKPECGFILQDGMECFDNDQLQDFDAWLTEQNLQAICTRVGTEDCTIVIEDGVAVQEGVEPAPEIPSPNDPIPESPEKTDEPKEEMEW